MNAESQSRALIIKGYGDGLLVALGDADWELEQRMLLEQIASQEAFFEGAKLAVDVGSRVLRAGEIDQLKAKLIALNVSLTAVLGCAPATLYSTRMLGIPTSLRQEKPPSENDQDGAAHAKYYRSPIKPNAVIESDSHLVIFGDVGPGITLEAKGSIIVWGRLLGSVHAGIGGNDLAEVCAIELKPSQLRIAGIYYNPHKRLGRSKPEAARICRGSIVFESWNKKS